MPSAEFYRHSPGREHSESHFSATTDYDFVFPIYQRRNATNVGASLIQPPLLPCTQSDCDRKTIVFMLAVCDSTDASNNIISPKRRVVTPENNGQELKSMYINASVESARATASGEPRTRQSAPAHGRARSRRSARQLATTDRSVVRVFQ
ncbi:hypothetical protein ACJJTC_008343 [Scirpophaga incertulas]